MQNLLSILIILLSFCLTGPHSYGRRPGWKSNLWASIKKNLPADEREREIESWRKLIKFCLKFVVLLFVCCLHAQ